MSTRAGTAGDIAGLTPGCFGAPEDWGLSRRKHGEIQAELEDHLDCLQADEGIPAAEEVKASIALPAVRRKLAGVHLTDQVYATLNRLPTKQEWRELIFLLICFAVILLSDWLAGNILNLDWKFAYSASEALHTQAKEMYLMICAWLLQGVSRAAFFTGLLYSLYRAWKLGIGVFLARILQLKLIHTLIVVFAMLILGKLLWRYSPAMWGYVIPLPVCFNAVCIFAVLLISAALIYIISRRRFWAWSLGLVFCSVFLVAGGPVVLGEYSNTRPIALTEVSDGTGGTKYVPSTDQIEIDKRVQELQESNSKFLAKYGISLFDSIDAATNQFTTTEYFLEPLPGVCTVRECYQTEHQVLEYWGDDGYNVFEKRTEYLLGPIAVSGGGFGWLAVPIPLLGLFGFIGLVVIMGRRGSYEFIAYTAICVFAIASTVFPFVYNSTPTEIVDLSPLGIVSNPLPAFIDFLGFSEIDATWFMLVGGLVFSAGIPWLLTALFLRPDSAAEKGPEFSNDPQPE